MRDRECKISLYAYFISRQKVITELTDKCKSQEGKMQQVKGFEAERRKYEVCLTHVLLYFIMGSYFRPELRS